MNKSLLFTIDFPPHVGGVANYYREFCNHLPSDKIVVLALKSGKELDFNYKVYREKLIAGKFIWPKWLPAFWYLYKVVKKEKIKNVLVGQGLPLGIVAYCLSKILKFDYYIIFHGLDIVTTKKIKRKRFLMEKIFTKVKGVIANSEFTKREILEMGLNENKIKVLYACPHFKPPAKNNIKEDIIKKYNLENKKILLSVGRAVERKGFDRVIKAMEKVVNKDEKVVYLLAGGKGVYTEQLKNLIKNSLVKDNIIFLEETVDEEVKALYDLCAVFIMPSRQIGSDVEGFGIVYLEANLFGKPVIGGRSGGAVEAVVDNKTGLVVDPENISEISEAILKLIKNPDLAKKLGEEGRTRAEQEFTWDKQVQKLKNIL
jgi:phosphatidyl-myo-inositol dimannoside synthase